MTESAPHPVLAFFVDFWLIANLTAGMKLSAPSSMGMIADVALAIVALLFLAVPILYHAIWRRHTSFLTPGELAAGVFRRGNEKIWCNPYGSSRQLLYGCVIWALFVNVPTVAITSQTDHALHLVLAALVAACLIGIGRGEWMGLIGLAAYRLWETYASSSSTLTNRSLPELIDAYSGSLIFAFACCIVANEYRKRRIVAAATAS
jgi:hypothetical protein